MTIQRPAKKRKTFKSGFTKMLILLLIAALGVSALCIYSGYSKVVFFSNIGFGQTLDCYLFGYFPIVFGGFLFLITIVVLLSGFNQYIVITPQALSYQKGKFSFSESWEDLSFSAPKSGKGSLVRSLSIGAKGRTIRIDSIFFDKFDTIAEIVRVAKDSRKTRLMDLEI
ncbi:MAG: hypothetical protein AB9903_19655 [Vulcanimicrobiota bacterium]